MSKTGVLDLLISVPAPVPVVWAAWSNEQMFGTWYTPMADWPCDLRAFSFEVGGKQIIAFGAEGEPPYVEENVLLEIHPNQKLVFTTAMQQGDHRFDDTHCVLTFAPAEDGGTILHLVETGISEDEVENRRGGWTGTFENLARLLADDGVAQTWSGTFAASRARVWQAFLSADDIAKWFTPFEGAAIEVHECGSAVGDRRRITFGKGEPWEHTITETILAITPEEEITLAVDMEMEGQSYSTLKGVVTFSDVANGTQIDLAVTEGPTPERVLRCGGWGMTLANLTLAL